MTYRPNLPSPIASTILAGVIKADGTTITVAPDATASVIGTAVTALTDITTGTLGGPAASDVDSLNRAGTDYKVTLSARAAFFRKTPAGSRSIILVAGGVGAILTAGDNDKQVVVTGAAGTLSGDGTITDGFNCLVINKTGGALSYSGINGLGGLTSLVSGGAARVYMAASALEATVVGGGSAVQPASTSALGVVKPDGTSLAAASDGTLSVITTTTHALPIGTAINSADEIATYSTASASDVKYSLAQIGASTLSSIQSWTTAARPAATTGQYVIGYNTTLSRYEFWNGTTWNQHVRVSDLAATSSQIFGGSGNNGIATAINVGTGLQLAAGTLSAGPATVPAIVVGASGSSQALSFPQSGSRAYDITLTSNCSLTLSGGNIGELQTLTLILRGGAGGFSLSLPSNVKWKGGNAPSVDTSAGSLYLLRIQTSDGGSSYAGNY